MKFKFCDGYLYLRLPPKPPSHRDLRDSKPTNMHALRVDMASCSRKRLSTCLGSLDSIILSGNCRI